MWKFHRFLEGEGRLLCGKGADLSATKRTARTLREIDV
jgi:hypothetical protein